MCLPAEPVFHSRDANNTNTNRLELGVSFSSGLPGWFLSCFFVGFIKDFSGTAQTFLGFDLAIGFSDGGAISGLSGSGVRSGLSGGGAI